MATVRQLITEIRLHPQMNDKQKAYVEDLLVWAEARVKKAQLEKQRTSVMRTAHGSKLLLLEEWEAKHGLLTIEDIETWVVKRKLDPQIIGMLIEEFRTDMKSKDKRYADFACAFQNYLNRGYLSKPLSMCGRTQYTTMDKRGVTL